MAEQSGQYELAIAKAQMRAAKVRQTSADGLGDQMRANKAELTSRMLGATLGIALLAVFVFAGSQFAWLVNTVAGVLAVGLTVSIAARRRRMAAARTAQYEAQSLEKAADNPSDAIRARQDGMNM